MAACETNPAHANRACHSPRVARTLHFVGLTLAGLVLGGCATPREAWHSSPLASEHVASPNFGERRPSLIVLHHTGESSFAAALKTLSDGRSGVSAHYLIGRDGLIAQLVDERARAWHAGVARWGPVTDVNSESIGIELDNNGSEPFANAQIDALLRLLSDLIARYHIDPRNVVGHADVAPHRKDDPSALFPWSRLAASGIGLWCSSLPAEPPGAGFDEAITLRLIGYEVASADDLVAARHAFRLHFIGRDVTGPVTPDEAWQMACIAQQQAAREAPQSESAGL